MANERVATENRLAEGVTAAKLGKVIERGAWVWFQNNYDPDPCPALITYVWPNAEEKLLNLTIFDRDGEARAAGRVYRGGHAGTWRPNRDGD